MYHILSFQTPMVIQADMSPTVCRVSREWPLPTPPRRQLHLISRAQQQCFAFAKPSELPFDIHSFPYFNVVQVSSSSPPKAITAWRGSAMMSSPRALRRIHTVGFVWALGFKFAWPVHAVPKFWISKSTAVFHLISNGP